MTLTIEDYKKYVESIVSERENNTLLIYGVNFLKLIVIEKEESPKKRYILSVPYHLFFTTHSKKYR